MVFLLVVADVEREGDDVPGGVGREARERLRGQRHERLAMGLLVGREADRGDLAVRLQGGNLQKAQACGFLPYARRDLEVEIARCSLRVVTLKASPTRLPKSRKNAAKRREPSGL